MKLFALNLVLAIFLAVTIVPAADAGPLGGRKSVGMKRDAMPQKSATPPTAAPAQNAQAAKAATPPPAAPAPSGMSKWLGPLAGLAAGGLLASLFMGGGFGGIKMFDILLLLGLAFAGFMIWRMMASRKAAAEGKLQYAGNASAAPEVMREAVPISRSQGATPEIGSRLGGSLPVSATSIDNTPPRIPADFDVEPFLRQGRIAFTRMQAANDSRDINDIREFTTPEMYAEIAMQIQERGNVAQRTEIVNMDAVLLEVVREEMRTIASVRFTGQYRDSATGPLESLDEVWHVVQRRDIPNASWLLAGIQQVE